jgi:hypothetical protein
MKSHRRHQEEIRIRGLASRECCEIGPTSPTGALPHYVLDGIIDHVTAVAKKKNLVRFVTFASDLFQIEVSQH